MISTSRERTLAFARQIGMYLARQLTAHSLEEIGSLFGNRNHATVIHAVQKISKLLAEEDELVRRDLDALNDRLRPHS